MSKDEHSFKSVHDSLDLSLLTLVRSGSGRALAAAGAPELEQLRACRWQFECPLREQESPILEPGRHSSGR